jgi:adenine-specific DNA-methyltransferase
MRYFVSRHSARHTDNFVFSQLIPYLGNKRKLLHLIGAAIQATRLDPCQSTFLDAFSGSTVVSRSAKRLGFQVSANDWEPYAEVLAEAAVLLNKAPAYFGGTLYSQVLAELNSLPPRESWITQHLCPRDDRHPDFDRDRMFYMRRNGMRLDAVREQISAWDTAGQLTQPQRAALFAPLLYQACWLSNTSGVFKGFHRGWGGHTQTALYRIAAEFHLRPAIFFDNGRENTVTRLDAQQLASDSKRAKPFDIAYLDPPYNQHPYGSNYHVLNSLTLWDKPWLSPAITGRGSKSAIRLDWRTTRRSPYNHRASAAEAYATLSATLNARFLCTSYSTDGLIPLQDMIASNLRRGETTIFLQGYKRYRVSAQRFSAKPMNVEFVLLTDTTRKATRSVDACVQEILQKESTVLSARAGGSAACPGTFGL